MKYKILSPFTDAKGGKGGKGKGEVYRPNEEKLFPIDGVDVSAARIKELSTEANACGIPLIEATETEQEPDNK